MYVRLFRDQSGKVFVQQFLTFQAPAKNGVQQAPESKWENIPTVGVGGNEAFDLPVTSSCGVFLFECRETIFTSVSEGHKDVDVTYAVSALDIYKISPKESAVMVFTKDKLNFTINLPYHQFMELMISMLNNFKIVRFNSSGRLIKE